MQRWIPFQFCTFGLALGFGLCAAHADLVVFSQIMYHPATGKPEYLVVENVSATPLDIAEWQCTKGIKFTFPSFSTNAPMATFLPAHEAIIVASAGEAETRAAYHVPPSQRIFGPWAGKLDNDGERVTLTDKNGVIVCTLEYRHARALAVGGGRDRVRVGVAASQSSRGRLAELDG